jgi:hypothetical protein
MKKVLCGAALALAATTGVASAQPYGGSHQPMATLYDQPGYRGRQTVVYGHAENLPRQYDDMAMSGRFEGRWRICEDSDYGGRCIDVQGDVADLNALGFGYRISSMQAYAEMDDGDDSPDTQRYGGGYGSGSSGGGYGGQNDRPAEGARNVFFAYPTFRGSDIAASPGAADRFCRANRLGPSSYFDTSARSNRPVDADGRYMPPGPVLRDVLCRR